MQPISKFIRCNFCGDNDDNTEVNDIKYLKYKGKLKNFNKDYSICNDCACESQFYKYDKKTQTLILRLEPVFAIADQSIKKYNFNELDKCDFLNI